MIAVMFLLRKLGFGTDEKKQEQEGILLAYGNPLLDISVNDDSCVSLLEKYDLKANNAILAEEKHLPMYDELVDKYPNKVEFIPGGATLNTMRAVQWLLQKPKSTTYFGCINKDKNGDIIKQKCEEAGVNVQFQYTDKERTGTCGVICTGGDRSLIANLAAANCFTEQHLDDPANWKLVEKAQFYYSAGFPLTVSPASMLRMARHSKEKGKTYCMNLSAPFLCSVFKEPMMQLLPFVDFLFCNESEADEFAKVHEYGTTDRKEIALKMADLPKEDSSRPRTVVITQGPDPVLVAKDKKVTEYPVKQLPKEKIVDTNGAGDGFVGGFLSQLVQGKSLEECVRCGMYVGNVIVQQAGFTLPGSPSFA
ncbi:uncharacterized protein LOC143292942 isoform X2 [Babylonia areolata]|uniref:uncharacterized protein LOC143292942 isoform X2 n=1 Tax=Babylonia areolata TaxID=304850 RepID=UPI003FD315CB